MRKSLYDKLTSAAFMLAVMFLASVGGVASVYGGVFPYTTVRDALVGWRELQHLAELGTLPHPHRIASPFSDLPIVEARADVAHEKRLTAISRFGGEAFEVALIDEVGDLLHRWRLPEEVIAAADRAGAPLDPGYYEIMGSHIDTDGSLLLSISYRVMAKLDRCGELVWLLEEPTHHDIEPLPNGEIWVPSRSYVSEEIAGREGFQLPYYDDELLRLSPDGEVLERFSVIDAFMKSDYRGVLLGGHQSYAVVAQEDPLHLNDVDVIGEAFASEVPFADAGDLLVSLRAIDAIAIIDSETKLVRWALSGPFLRQHDPDTHDDGTITVFDNRTDRDQHNGAIYVSDGQRFGHSRVVRFDPRSHRQIWQFEGSADAPFYSSIQGDQQTLDNGRVLITESEGGRLLELDPATGGIVWEYRNIVEHDGQNWSARITEARRYPNAMRELFEVPCSATRAHSLAAMTPLSD